MINIKRFVKKFKRKQDKHMEYLKRNNELLLASELRQEFEKFGVYLDNPHRTTTETITMAKKLMSFMDSQKRKVKHSTRTEKKNRVSAGFNIIRNMVFGNVLQ